MTAPCIRSDCDQIGIGGRIPVHPDGERGAVDYMRLAVFQPPAYLAEPASRHQRLAILADYVNITTFRTSKISLTICNSPAKAGLNAHRSC